MKIHLTNGFRLQYEEVKKAFVLLFPEGLVELNVSSAEILKLCNGLYSEAEVISQIEQKFPNDNVTNDIKSFLFVAFEREWIHAK